MEKIKLSLVYQALDMISQDCRVFIDLTKNEVVEIYEFMDEEEKEEMYIEIDNNRDNYLSLPEQYEMDGYNRMVRFIYSLENVEHRNKLLYTIQGKGAFRRFKDSLIMLDIRHSWFEFERNELIELAKEILEENQIDYIDDLS